jgi:hypothetical protein
LYYKVNSYGYYAQINNLQNILEDKEGATIASSEKSSDTYGASTAHAVSVFQQKYKSDILTPQGFTQPTGIFDRLTREKMNKLYGCSQNASLSITSPTSSSATFQPGRTMEIKWNTTGTVRYVKIEVYRGSTKTVLTNYTSNRGSYLWRIPYNQTTGDYEVRVSNVDNSSIKASAPFKIGSGTSSSSISITSPDENEVLHPGESFDIEWRAPNVSSLRIQYSKNDVVYSIDNYVMASDEEYRWRVPSSLREGTYKLRLVSRTDSSVYAERTIKIED